MKKASISAKRKIEAAIKPLFLVVDLFCGAGGTTTGFTKGRIKPSDIFESVEEFAKVAGFDDVFAKDNFNKKVRIAKVIACVNHDPIAIKSHWMNHPEVKHFEEDIRTLDLTDLIELVRKYREIYPDAVLILWASLECTNFSKAKGGQPRDADSRTLAEHLERYIVALDPDFIQIENVVEFMSWGPLDESGKPISRKNGSDWMRWRQEICGMGYYDEWHEMNSANFGAYTSRNRLFGCFAKHHLFIVWPEATHSKNPSKNSMYGDLKKWEPVKDVLNFEDEGESIFTRKKPLSDKTLERIYAGLVKYIAKGDTSFISKYYSGRPAGKVTSVDMPAGTITTVGNQTLVQPEFLLKYNSCDKNGKHTPPSIEEPCPVISTQGRLGLVQTEFISSYYSTGSNISSIEDPCPTLRTKAGQALIKPKYFIDQQYGNSKPSDVEDIAGTLTSNPKLALVQADPFIMPTNYNNQPKSINEPLQTITANRKHHYIINPSHGGNNHSVEVPCPVIIARQDKAPLYFVQVEAGSLAIAIFDCDTEVMVRIKQFMSVYGLIDIKMRMLRVPELLKIQGFPDNYQLAGNQSDQKKFIGNSVHPIVVKKWIEIMALKIFGTKIFSLKNFEFIKKIA